MSKLSFKYLDLVLIEVDDKTPTLQIVIKVPVGPTASKVKLHWPWRYLIDFVASKVPREKIAENYLVNEFSLQSTANDFPLIKDH